MERRENDSLGCQAEFERWDNHPLGSIAFAISEESKILYCNKVFAAFLGDIPSSLEGMSLDDLTVSRMLFRTRYSTSQIKEHPFLRMQHGRPVRFICSRDEQIKLVIYDMQLIRARSDVVVFCHARLAGRGDRAIQSIKEASKAVPFAVGVVNWISKNPKTLAVGTALITGLVQNPSVKALLIDILSIVL